LAAALARRGQGDANPTAGTPRSPHWHKGFPCSVYFANMACLLTLGGLPELCELYVFLTILGGRIEFVEQAGALPLVSHWPGLGA
jgi:hypothetical protein